MKPKGCLVVIDHLENDETKNSKERLEVEEMFKQAKAMHVIVRAGFDEKEMGEIYDGAGLKMDVFERLPDSVEGDLQAFVAVGGLKMD
jgi:hypothetical protein